MKTFLRTGLVAILAIGCVVDNPGSPLLVAGALTTTAPACTFDPTTITRLSSGRRDISANSLAAFGYQIGLIVQNNTKSVDDRPVAFGNLANVYVDSTDITIDGFNVCYELKDFRNTTQPTPAQPTYPTCKELAAASPPEPTFFISSAGVVTTAGTLALSLDLLPPAITGADLATPLGMATNRFENGLAADGDRRTVVVHLQAVGHTNDVAYVESNEMLFPVDLCVGCVPFRGACTAPKVPDRASVCFPGQDASPTCIDP